MTGYVADLSWESGARDWKVRSTKVDAGDLKHELLNRLRSTMAVNVLISVFAFRTTHHYECLYILRGLLDPEDEDIKMLRNVGSSYLPVGTL